LADGRSGDDHKNDAMPAEQQRFRDLSSLTNHRSRPAGPPAYYWYLTFELVQATGIDAVDAHGAVAAKAMRVLWQNPARS